MSTFAERIDDLLLRVGAGNLTAKVEFDQAYAHRQHEDLALKHTRGGGKYLEHALFDQEPILMNILAHAVLSDIRRGAISVTELVALRASKNAPKRAVGDTVLASSDHALVLDNGITIYDRPPRHLRLGDEEIEARNKALQDPHHYYGSRLEE